MSVKIEISRVVFLPGNVHCAEDTTVDYLERDVQVEVNWQATEVGSRRFVRCPYAFDRPLYAYRDCVLFSIIDQWPLWTDANVTMCPWPPFSQAVDRLANFVVSNLLVRQSVNFLSYVGRRP